MVVRTQYLYHLIWVLKDWGYVHTGERGRANRRRERFKFISPNLLPTMNNDEHKTLLAFFVIGATFGMVTTSTITIQITMAALSSNATNITNTASPLILGNPYYVEYDKPTGMKHILINGTTNATEVTFSGQGVANGVNYTDSGKALVTIRDNGKVINTKGHVAIMTSSGGGKASADFQEIGHAPEGNNKGIVVTATGTAFFDANATGKLAFLGNAVAIYKDQIYKDGTDKLVAWEWK